MGKNIYTFFLILLLLLTNKVVAQVVPAEPVAGKALTKQIVQRHLKYPSELLKLKKSGKVTVGLDIDKDGNGSNYHIINTFDDAASEEALILVRQIVWNPCTKDGIATDSHSEYVVNFSTKSYLKNIEKHRIPTLPTQGIPQSKSYKIYEANDLDKSPSVYFENPNMNLASYLQLEMKYPDQAKEFEISGTVKMNFIIEKDGMASNITIEESVGGGCDNEAIRLLQNLVWTPGIKNDSVVRTKSSQEIIFQFGERNYHEGNRY